MAAENLTSVFAVWDSVVFLGGIAIGFSGNRGVNFMANTIDRLRGAKSPTTESSETK